MKEPLQTARHGAHLPEPFTTCRTPGIQHAIIMQGDEPWLCWKHSDGNWVTESKVVYTEQPVGDAALREHVNPKVANHLREIVAGVRMSPWSTNVLLRLADNLEIALGVIPARPKQVAKQEELNAGCSKKHPWCD